MKLSKNDLRKCFETAEKIGYEFVAVKIDMQGFDHPEIVINRKGNYEDKMNYYENAYDDNLILKAYNGIRIIDYTYADTFEQIEEDLVDA